MFFTFSEDISNRETLLAYLSHLTEQVTARLREKNRKGKTVSVKVRFHDFTTIVRSKTLTQSSHQTEQIWQVAKRLFNEALPAGQVAIRLLGVGVSGFTNETVSQGDLFAEDAKHNELDEVSDEINQRFGKLKIHRGRNTN